MSSPSWVVKEKKVPRVLFSPSRASLTSSLFALSSPPRGIHKTLPTFPNFVSSTGGHVSGFPNLFALRAMLRANERRYAFAVCLPRARAFPIFSLDFPLGLHLWKFDYQIVPRNSAAPRNGLSQYESELTN